MDLNYIKLDKSKDLTIKNKFLTQIIENGINLMIGMLIDLIN